MDLKTTSKFLSLILRHQPGVIGLKLENNGWANVDELISGMNKQGHRVTRQILDQIVSEDSKSRYIYSEDKSKIRANQGHSINVDLELAEKTPPEFLFHGTATRFIDSISKTGLKSGSRQHVHLSQNESIAKDVGKRHGEPIVLTIRAGQLAKTGHKFYLSDNNVWLTESIPVDYITFIEQRT